MADIYANTAAGFDLDETPIDVGRMGGILCQLHRRKFTGALRIESGERSAMVGFRTGQAVCCEEPSSTETLGDVLVERGTLTRAQYARVIAAVTEGLVENEDMAFCEHAVAMGFLDNDQAHTELSERTRTRLLQLLSWRDCEFWLDESEEALLGHGEYPQELGAIVYIGVRTFYDDELLRSYLPDPTRHYAQLSTTPARIAEFFALEADESKLLRALDPESPLDTLIRASILPPADAIAVLALVRIAGLCECATKAFSQPAEQERSGTRPTPKGGTGTSRGGMPAVRSPSERPTEATPGRMRASLPPETTAARMPPARPRGTSSTTTTAQRAPSVALGPAAREVANSRAQSQDMRDARPVSGAANPAVRPRSASPSNLDTDELTAAALREAAARAARARKPIPTPTAQRLIQDQPLQRTAATNTGPIHRAATAPVPAKPATAVPAAPVDPTQRAEYKKAHLNELIQRRQKAMQAPADPVADAKRDSARELRQAQELLRDHHYARAEELLRSAVEREPDNTVLRTYHLWAKFRLGPELDNAEIGQLLDFAKKLLAIPEHGAFGCYMLGHLYMAAKKDDLAEKYFKRAHAGDKTNKDAERHLLILERRKQVATEGENNGNRKLFGITIAGKPKT